MAAFVVVLSTCGQELLPFDGIPLNECIGQNLAVATPRLLRAYLVIY